MATIYLIRIPDKEARQKAIGRFLDVRETWVSFPGHVLGITSEHLQALEQAQPPIPFEWVSEKSNGQAAPSVQP